MSTQLIILGGFLGSGKTTLMLKMAEYYTQQGLRVALITNDQGDMLVDTGAASEKGFPTGQVSAGCFCCHFSDFMENVDQFLSDLDPDLIIAEPVGSCTDLVSTLAAPIQNFYKEKLDLKGIFVLVDAYRLTNTWEELNLPSPATPEEVLLSHQIKEAGYLLLSKADLLDDEQMEEAKSKLRSLNEEAQFVSYSAFEQKDVINLSAMMIQSKAQDLMLKSIDLDYDVYAVAEAELGWYNGTWEFSSDEAFSLSDYLLDLSDLFNDPMLGTVSHGKVFLVTEDSSVKLSFVDGIMRSDSVQTGSDSVKELRAILNIRSKSTPEEIEKVVEKALSSLMDKYKGANKGYTCKSLIPSPPKPEHRIIV